MFQRTVTTAALLLACVACQGGPPTAEELNAADFGAMPAEPEPAIRSHFDQTLKDPESARYQVGNPVKGYYGKTTNNLAGPRDVKFGWLVPTKVNAKNGFGGYTGWHLYHCWFRGESLVRVIDLAKLSRMVANSAPLPSQ